MNAFCEQFMEQHNETSSIDEMWESLEVTAKELFKRMFPQCQL